MPICANCRCMFEYKDGMVCKRCGLDAKRYWFVSRNLLYLKCNPTARTITKIAQMVFWIVIPTLVAIGIAIAIYWWGYRVISFAFFFVVVVPTATIFTALPIRALLIKDHLRR